MDIYQRIDAMRPFIAGRDWQGLEEAFRAVCEALAGPELARRIAALDFPGYRARLQASYAEAARRFAGSGAVALFFEYDLDGRWEGRFFLCQAYHPEAAGDEDWACAWVADVEAPSFPEASAIYLENGFGRTERARGATSYLVARTVAALGRCTEAVEVPARAVCIAFHDQTPIQRLLERA